MIFLMFGGKRWPNELVKKLINQWQRCFRTATATPDPLDIRFFSLKYVSLIYFRGLFSYNLTNLLKCQPWCSDWLLNDQPRKVCQRDRFLTGSRSQRPDCAWRLDSFNWNPGCVRRLDSFNLALEQKGHGGKATEGRREYLSSCLVGCKLRNVQSSPSPSSGQSQTLFRYWDEHILPCLGLRPATRQSPIKIQAKPSSMLNFLLSPRQRPTKFHSYRANLSQLRLQN